MLLIETYISRTDRRGFGLFSKNNISKGTKYWARNEIFDKVVSIDELESMPKIASDYFRKYGFQEINMNWYLCGDHARFSNHSEHPNTKNYFDSNGLIQYSTLTKDISTGEEILIDYTELCLTCRDGVIFQEL